VKEGPREDFAGSSFICGMILIDLTIVVSGGGRSKH
jgi:hypothetical protein